MRATSSRSPPAGQLPPPRPSPPPLSRPCSSMPWRASCPLEAEPYRSRSSFSPPPRHRRPHSTPTWRRRECATWRSDWSAARSWGSRPRSARGGSRAVTLRPHEPQPAAGTARYCASSFRGERDGAGAARHFDIVAPDCALVARALQPRVVTHLSEDLVVEGEVGGPPFETDPGGNARRAPQADRGGPSSDPHRHRAGRRGQRHPDLAQPALDFEPTERKAAQLGDDLRGPALDLDPPRHRRAERDLCCPIVPSGEPPPPRIADDDSPARARYPRRRPLEVRPIQPR